MDLIKKYKQTSTDEYFKKQKELYDIFIKKLESYVSLDEQLNNLIPPLLNELHLVIDNVEIIGGFVRIYAKSIDDKFKFFDSSKRGQLQTP